MTKKLTISALLVALAMILSYVEVLIPFNFGIPGIKLGLANLVVVVALYLLNARQALMISVVRILLVSFTFGNMAALLYSITGGLLSFAVMVLCRRIKGLSTMSVSVAGGCCRSQSITTTQSPAASDKPANIADSLPKFLEKFNPRMLGF